LLMDTGCRVGNVPQSVGDAFCLFVVHILTS
jgi:hypothetical protein